MQRLACVLIVLCTPVLAVADDEVQKELKSLQGKWKTVDMEAGGKPVPKEAAPDFRITIGADGKSTGKMPQEEFGFVMTVNPKKDPKAIEVLHESGTEKGKKQFGIYKLDGDKWTVCMTMPGSAETDRPKDFNTKDTTHVVFVFERVKEEKKR
jgi:uncharacterized protein (TIGR03067 family)